MHTRVTMLLACSVLCFAASVHAAAIHSAAQRGDLAKVKALIAKNPKLVNANEYDDTYPLHNAVGGNHQDVAAYLISKGADTNARCADGFTPLEYAAFLKHRKMFDFLVSKGVKPNILCYVWLGDLAVIRDMVSKDPKLVNTLDPDGDPILVEAILQKQPAAAKLLLELGADVNIYWKSNGSALFRSIQAGSAEITEMLLARGADVNAVSSGGTPLSAAIAHNDEKTLDLLISKGANVNVQWGGRQTPLSSAVACRNMAITKRLVAAGAKIDAYSAVYLGSVDEATPLVAALGNRINDVGPSGATLLTLAVDTQNEPMVKMLLSKGASPTQWDSNAIPPLGYAAKHNSVAIAKLLIASGAELDTPDDAGNAPLHCAAGAGSTEVASLLLEKGADVNVGNGLSCIPLHIAAGSGQLAMAELLISKGAKINALAPEGSAPLHEAARTTSVALVKLLISHGAKVNAKNELGASPMDYASDKGVRELLRKHGGKCLLPRNTKRSKGEEEPVVEFDPIYVE